MEERKMTRDEWINSLFDSEAPDCFINGGAEPLTLLDKLRIDTSSALKKQMAGLDKTASAVEEAIYNRIKAFEDAHPEPEYDEPDQPADELEEIDGAECRRVCCENCYFGCQISPGVAGYVAIVCIRYPPKYKKGDYCSVVSVSPTYLCSEFESQP